MKPYIYPYKLTSVSARRLADMLGTICIRENGKFKPYYDKLVVNWGNPRIGKLNLEYPVLNDPHMIECSINKLSTLSALSSKGFSEIPDWTTDRSIAEQWLSKDFPVIVRHKLRSSGGDGVEVVQPGGSLPPAPLYTRLFSKDKEYRVHVFRDAVIDFVQKKLKAGFTPKPYIRSHHNGWVFCRQGVELPESVKDISVKIVKALGLDFGAVDVAISKKGKVCVFEVNTAPGIEGVTVGNYAKAITAYLEQLQNANSHGDNH